MPKPIKDEIWILADNRAGNYSQAIGLANALGFDYKIVNISYGLFAILPNIVLRSSLFGIDRETKERLKEMKYFPKIIIAAGRRSAPILLYLKKKSQNRSKIVQIMSPNANFEQFDFIILPRHDKMTKNNHNIIRTLGALTKIDDVTIKYEYEKYKSWFENDKKTKIALFIGGSAKKTHFSKENAIKLVQKSVEIANNMNAKLYVLNSRRTSDEINNAIRLTLKSMNCDYKFFDFQELKNDNPYLSIIAIADFFVVSGDSVSMISESCSTGKPVYIFDEENISTKKHKNFHKCLLLENYVRRLDDKTNLLENFIPKRLNETKRVALIIKNSLV